MLGQTSNARQTKNRHNNTTNNNNIYNKIHKTKIIKLMMLITGLLNGKHLN